MTLPNFTDLGFMHRNFAFRKAIMAAVAIPAPGSLGMFAAASDDGTAAIFEMKPRQEGAGGGGGGGEEEGGVSKTFHS